GSLGVISDLLLDGGLSMFDREARDLDSAAIRRPQIHCPARFDHIRSAQRGGFELVRHPKVELVARSDRVGRLRVDFRIGLCIGFLIRLRVTPAFGYGHPWNGLPEADY